MGRRELLAIAFVAASLGAGATGLGPGPFVITAPVDRATGRVVVRADVTDPAVTSVRWTVADWSRVTEAPFELSFDAGPLPVERRIVAVALNRDRQPLYRREVVLNPGGRGTDLEFLSPIDGQKVSGNVRVALRVKLPADDAVASLALEGDGLPQPVAQSDGTYATSLDLPEGPSALVARLVSRRGRETSRTSLVNARGFLAQSDAHAVDQLVAVTQGGRPLENLVREDFTVSTPKGPAEIREVRLVRDAPLALGFAIDISASLQHTEELKQVTARQFVENVVGPKDSAFVLAFGPVPVNALDWTTSKTEVQSSLLSLSTASEGGTALFDALIEAIYRFQGQQGARALVLITDGYASEGDAKEEDALAYARLSGVPIYVLGLTSGIETLRRITRVNEKGETELVRIDRSLDIAPPNEKLLQRLAETTGGTFSHVKKPADLARIYREIERDLRTQYVVSYTTRERHQDKFHPVEVRSRRGKVRTVPGFFY